MLKILRKYLKQTVSIASVLLILFLLVITYQVSQSRNLLGISINTTPTRPIYCVPLPTKVIDLGALSPSITPAINRGEKQLPIVPQATQSKITLTPVLKDHLFDLNPDLSSQQKGEIDVFRCDGTMDVYFLSSDIDYKSAISLNPGDVIWIMVPPASLMGHHVNPFDPTITTVSTVIANPSNPINLDYPAPPTPTPHPYP